MTLNDLLAGGPGHDGYAYNADVYCVECGRDIIHEVARVHGFLSATDDQLRDSEYVPQPIFFGESDIAQHCSSCREYLYGPQESEADKEDDSSDVE